MIFKLQNMKNVLKLSAVVALFMVSTSCENDIVKNKTKLRTG